MLHSDQLISNEERVLAAVGTGGFLLVRRDGLDVSDDIRPSAMQTQGHLRGDVQGWAWKVLDFEGNLLGHGNDLFSPHHASLKSNYEVVKTLGTLISFLSACAESEEDGENYSLFGPAVRVWAEMNSDELQLLGLEIASMIGESL